MTNAELIKALRYCISDEYVEKGCLICPICAPRQGEMKCNSQDDAIKYAADALEAAEKRIDYLQKLVDINTERCEALRKQLRESHESYEKHINELEAQLPKEGEWVEDDTTYCGADRANYNCSLCGKICGTWKRGLTQDELPNYCPNCGAKMKGENDGET